MAKTTSKLVSKKALPASQTIVANEQSAINAMIQWLFKNNEALIDCFDFKKLPKIDRKNDAIRRSTFRPSEIYDIGVPIPKYWDRERNKQGEREWLARSLACFYFLIASVTGLRTGEQRQMKWGDWEWTGSAKGKNSVALVKIKVRAETSKVRQGRKFMIRDNGCFTELRKLQRPCMSVVRSSIVFCSV